MIDNLKISYVQDRNISVTLSTEHGHDLPYSLAAVFAKAIRDSGANIGAVIEDLNSELVSDK